MTHDDVVLFQSIESKLTDAKQFLRLAGTEHDDGTFRAKAKGLLAAVSNTSAKLCQGVDRH